MTKISNAARAALVAVAVAAAVLSWATPASADVDGNWNETTVGAREQPVVPMPADVAFTVQCEHRSVVEHSVS
ncbi:hypothetical protein OG216_42900 [Streptomycetaceae bacterium NBC_01309]